MHSCPNCHIACIPKYRALVDLAFTPPIKCPSCGTMLKTHYTYWRNLLAMAPVVAAMYVVSHYDVQDPHVAFFCFGMGGALGISLTLNAFEYRIVSSSEGPGPIGGSSLGTRR